MKKIVITGATSMLGLSLVNACIAKGIHVLAIVRENSAKENLLPRSNLLQILYADAGQLGQIACADASCDAFYHFAWTYTDRVGRTDPARQQENIAYTLDAIRLAKRLGCHIFIGAGSQAEYGRHVDAKTGPDSWVNPQMAYGVAKYAAGKLGAMLARQLEMDFAWVRIFSVFGPGEQSDTMISSTIRKLKNGEHASFTPAVHTWDYLYASDAAEALYLIGEKVTGSKVFCLGSGHGRPLCEYIQEMVEVVAPGTELGLGDIPYSSEELPNMCADIASLTEATGWTPSISFKEGIQKVSDFTPCIFSPKE